MVFVSKINYDFFLLLMSVLSKFKAPVVFPRHFDPATFSGAMGHTIMLSSTMNINTHPPTHTHTMTSNTH